MNFEKLAITAALFVALGATSQAQHPQFPPNEAAGVQTRRGNPSPAAGLSAGQTNSRIDDYFNQDEQINIDPDSGVVKVLRVNQKNLINDFVTAYIPVKSASIRELRTALRTITGQEGGRAEVIRDKIKEEYFMQVICPKFQVPWIEAAIRALDVEWLEDARDGSFTLVYQGKYRPAESIDPFAEQFAGEGSSAFDPNANTVTRRDTEYRVQNYLRGAKMVDIPPPQALFEFKIYEIDTNNDLTLGVDWIAWKNGPGRSLFEKICAGQDSNQNYEDATGFFDPNLGAFTVLSSGSSDIGFKATQCLCSFNYLLTSAFLDFLRVKGKARVLAAPQLYVRTHQTATWRSTDQFLAFDVTPTVTDALGRVPTRLNAFSTTNPDDPPTALHVNPYNQWTVDSDFAAHNRFLNHRQGGELGLELQVHAAIGTESTEADIEFVSTDLAGTTPQGTPIISNRRIVTALRLVNGMTTVFGGLTREEDVAASNKAPWLGDIPVLGYLFGQESSVKRRKQIVISVTPHFFEGCAEGVVDPVMMDTMAMARGDSEIEVPETSFGFDQWLFDEVEKP